MTTKTQTITEFLLARIAEDEALSRAATHPDWVSWSEGRDGSGGDSGLFVGGQSDVYGWASVADQDHAARHDPARVLAECEAKRQILKWTEITEATQEDDWSSAGDYATALYTNQSVQRAMASVYADHPDYRDEWRA